MNQQKIAKKSSHFTIQFRSKNLSHFTNLNLLDIENNMLQKQPKAFLTLQIFRQKCFYVVSEKIFALHHFLTSKNCILEARCKQMLFPRHSRVLSGGSGGRLNNFLKAARCLGLAKCFTIFFNFQTIWTSRVRLQVHFS